MIKVYVTTQEILTCVDRFRKRLVAEIVHYTNRLRTFVHAIQFIIFCGHELSKISYLKKKST